MINSKFRWIPPILWGLLISVLSLIPGGPGNLSFLGIPYFDKIGHFCMYGVWAFLIFNALSKNPTATSGKTFWVTFVSGTIVGILLEYAQFQMTVGRAFEINDMIANALGSLMGALSGLFFNRFRNQRKLSG